MTDNEKAAMEGRLWDGTDEAPDMSRPENYMRAFEGLCSRPEIKWGISSGWIKGKSYTTYAIELTTGPDASRVIKLAGTPVEALAALYDKEISHE